MRSIPASELRAKCQAILDEVEQTGEPVVILRHGRPVACLVALALGKGEYPQRGLFGTVEIPGDVVEPVLPAGEWEAESDQGR
jgi:prevent-host-death family protein